MTLQMNDSSIASIQDIKEFLKVENNIRFVAVSKKEKYRWIDDVLTKFGYLTLKSKKDKSIVRKYIRKMTGLSNAQTTRIIKKKKQCGKALLSSKKKNSFRERYGPQDIALLAKTDNLHNRMSGKATKKILQDECNLFHKKEYGNIAKISVSHLYNLRGTRIYRSQSITVKKTVPVKNNIGQRTKPDPQGIPGYLRIDTVHQGDFEGKKGAYHINVADETLQWEIVGCTQRISEFYLLPLLEDILDQFPCRLVNFHSDNGSEFINKQVSGMLNKLLISQTKSRARHCNDNGFIECKNGKVIRKNFGFGYIPAECAQAVNEFNKEHFNIYLNYCRPCAFPETITDAKGKRRKTYPQELYQTPYQKLRSLENAGQYLKPGITFEMLDKIATAKSPNEYAEIMQNAKDKLFESIQKTNHVPASVMPVLASAPETISCSFLD
jgi:transposase InsO family protein